MCVPAFVPAGGKRVLPLKEGNIAFRRNDSVGGKFALPGPLPRGEGESFGSVWTGGAFGEEVRPQRTGAEASIRETKSPRQTIPTELLRLKAAKGGTPNRCATPALRLKTVLLISWSASRSKKNRKLPWESVIRKFQPHFGVSHVILPFLQRTIRMRTDSAPAVTLRLCSNLKQR
jgi:hypothetical protein